MFTRRRLALGGLLGAFLRSGHAMDSPVDMAAQYVASVDKRLEIDAWGVQLYGQLVIDKLAKARLSGLAPQYLLLVDRSPQVQAILLFVIGFSRFPDLIGASPVSTGRPSGFEHFETPVGVFLHTTANLDYRSMGTKNDLGIRGYGAKGMRVYDFGWQQARKGWGDRATGSMRLQMHATDPDLLEHRLGSVQSKGCIRIPATLNRLIDTYGLLDADYESALRAGRSLWMLAPDRTPTPWSGRYLVVVDTGTRQRPAWSQAPTLR
jgi:hypothetical protein